MKKFAFVLLFFVLSIFCCDAFSQQLDQMTFKSFSTAKGQLLFLDYETQEALWRFENAIELRFPFKDINFILFGSERKVTVIVGQDSSSHVGYISEFSPDRGLKLKTAAKKNVSTILTDIRKIILEEPKTLSPSQ